MLVSTVTCCVVHNDIERSASYGPRFNKHWNVLGELFTLQSFGGRRISYAIFTDMTNPSPAVQFGQQSSLNKSCKIPKQNCFVFILHKKCSELYLIVFTIVLIIISFSRGLYSLNWIVSCLSVNPFLSSLVYLSLYVVRKTTKLLR